MRTLLAVTAAVLIAALPASAGVTTFAISGQSAGHVEFSVAVDDNHAPPNLSVTSRCFDDFSQPLSEQTVLVSGWLEGNGVLVGFASFDGPSGLRCYAFVHKGQSEKQLATFSYISP